MKIATIGAGVTSLVNKEIETSIQALMFDMTASTAGLADAPETLDNALGAVAYAAGNATITLTKESNQSTDPLQEKIKLLAIAEMSANNEGFIRVDYDQVAHTVRVRFTVELSRLGAFNLGDNTKVILNVESKPTAAIWDVSALDFPVVGRTSIRYEKKFVNGGVEKDFDVTGSAVMAFPVTSFDNIKIYYNNGKQILLTADELKQRLADSQDPVICFNGRVYYGYANLLVLNVEAAWKVSVLLNQSDTIYNIKEAII